MHGFLTRVTQPAPCTIHIIWQTTVHSETLYYSSHGSRRIRNRSQIFTIVSQRPNERHETWNNSSTANPHEFPKITKNAVLIRRCCRMCLATCLATCYIFVATSVARTLLEQHFRIRYESGVFLCRILSPFTLVGMNAELSTG